ncbi:MAG: hypothetical protein ACYTX0_43700, partial [Nostoc sp.]
CPLDCLLNPKNPTPAKAMLCLPLQIAAEFEIACRRRFEPLMIRLQSNRGFNRTEINRIQKLVQEHQEQLLVGWNDFFND